MPSSNSPAEIRQRRKRSFKEEANRVRQQLAAEKSDQDGAVGSGNLVGVGILLAVVLLLVLAYFKLNKE